MGFYRMRVVDPAEVDGLRSTVAPWLYGLATCSRGTNDLHASLDLCKAGLSQLWVGEDRETGEPKGAFLTEIRDHPFSRKSLCIWGAGGDVGGMVDDIESRDGRPNDIDRFAVEVGAQCIQFDFPMWAKKILDRVDPGRSSADIHVRSVLFERDLYREESP